MKFAAAGAAPTIIFAAHLFYGAAVPVAALVLFACLLGLLAVTLISADARRDLDRLSPTWPLIGLGSLIIAVILLSMTPWVPGGAHPIWVWSDGAPSSTLNRSATAIEVLKLVGLAAPFLLGCLLGARLDNSRRAYAAILIVGAAYAVVSLVAFLSQASVNMSGDRLSGGFESANIAGSVFGVLMMLAVAWAARLWKRMTRETLAERATVLAPTFAVILLALACLLLTASRGAIGATAFALTLFLGWAALDNRGSRLPLIVMGVALIVVAVVVYVQGNTLFVDRLGRLAEGDSSRVDLLAPHWRAFLDAPLFGSGLGSYPEVNNQIMTSQTAEALSSTVVLHNVYVQWLEEAGLVGAMPIFALIAVILGATAWRAIGRTRNRTLVVGLLSASLVVLLHASVDVSLNTPSFCALWSLLLGLGFAMSQASARQG